LREKGREFFVRQTLWEVSHYLEGFVASSRRVRSCAIAPPVLRPDDRKVLQVCDPGPVRGAAGLILAYLATFADELGRVANAVDLSTWRLERLCGQGRVAGAGARRRRVYVVALEQLERAGILSVHTDYSTAHHGRRYAVWYRFGSGALPEREEAGLVLGRRVVEEGELIVVASERPRGRPQVRFWRMLPVTATTAPGGTWWRRMHERRVTPAEFFGWQTRAGPRGRLPARGRAALGLAMV
jgi:hypothetical protein